MSSVTGPAGKWPQIALEAPAADTILPRLRCLPPEPFQKGMAGDGHPSHAMSTRSNRFDGVPALFPQFFKVYLTSLGVLFPINVM